jgi:hypothetical protein
MTAVYAWMFSGWKRPIWSSTATSMTADPATTTQPRRAIDDSASAMRPVRPVASVDHSYRAEVSKRFTVEEPASSVAARIPKPTPGEATANAAPAVRRASPQIRSRGRRAKPAL